MVVCPSVEALSDPPESVEIQLPLKARQLALAKVSSHHLRCESFGMAYHERPSVRLPRNDLWMQHSFLVEHAHELFRKGHGDPAGFLAYEVFGIGDGAVVVIDVLEGFGTGFSRG